MNYPKDKTEQISFPLGGIGAGCIGLAGNGQLMDWEIFNRPNKGSLIGSSHFAVRAEKEGKVLDGRVLIGDLAPPYMGERGRPNGHGFGHGPDVNNLCGFPHFREHRFVGEFPLASVHFSDSSFPGKPSLHAWSPFIPGDDYHSSLPIACYEVEIVNDTESSLDYTVVAALTNPYLEHTAWNRHHAEGGQHQLTMSRGGDTGDLGYGELTLSTAEEDVSYQEYWYRGNWRDDIEVYWNDFSKPGPFTNRHYELDVENPHIHYPAKAKVRDTGMLAAHFSLEPGQSQRVGFVISWHVPNQTNYWNKQADEMAASNGLQNRWRNWYATQWEDSLTSGAYALENYADLYEKTRRFHDALYASTLPEAVLDGVSSCLAVLRSPTCLRLEDGTFYGWEGINVSTGSCEGSCTHVWNYAQALAFLFPRLERSMRESHYRHSVDACGGSHFRLMLPLGIQADPDMHRPCVDGQFGDVIKAYRDWKICGDTEWLRGIWPTIKRTIAYAWSEENYDRWDPQRSGVITGRQHHTLDMELFGPNAWLNGFYLGALKAAAEMADALGETQCAEDYRDIFERGRAWTIENLFNGEYYCQLVDLEDRSILESYPRRGDDDSIALYWNDEHGEIRYQIGEGLGIDMHLPQWHATLYGLGDVLDPEQVRQTLLATYRHNFVTSMREVTNPWRIYCLNDEAGMCICSWPEGKRRPIIPAVYSTETMHGFEWAAASHLIMSGLVEEGESVVKAIRERYDGKKRNPWNEIECGSNYARSLAAYALLHAYSGFRFDRTRGYLGFKPVEPQGDEFRCFWSLGDAWGEYRRDAGSQQIRVLQGALELRELELPGGITSLSLGGDELAFTSEQGRARLKNAIVLSSEGASTLTIQ